MCIYDTNTGRQVQRGSRVRKQGKLYDNVPVATAGGAEVEERTWAFTSAGAPRAV